MRFGTGTTLCPYAQAARRTRVPVSQQRDRPVGDANSSIPSADGLCRRPLWSGGVGGTLSISIGDRGAAITLTRRLSAERDWCARCGQTPLGASKACPTRITALWS